MGDSMRIGGVSIEVFRRQPEWGGAVEQVCSAFERHADEVRNRVEEFHARYVGRRAAMVFDVIHSGNRNYEKVVLPRVEAFEAESGAASLRDLANLGPQGSSGFKRGEREAMQQLAGALADYCDDNDLSDDHGVMSWSSSLELGTHFALDPVIGRVKYLAATQYPYLRMRSGADDVKPDRRVANELRGVGVKVTNRPEHIHITARALAHDAAVRPIELDQLFWFGLR